MVPGIDFAGVVAESTAGLFKPGDPVVLTGWGVGENIGAVRATRAREVSVAVAIARGLTLKQAMQIGTAGLTAMFCVMALEEHGVRPDKGEIIVTGATGGVGCVAVMLLAKLGYRVVASTGKADAHEFLKSLGAHEVIDRNELAKRSDKPLERGRWAGAVDSVGGETLAALLRQMRREGCVTAVGLAGGAGASRHRLPIHLASGEPGRDFVRIYDGGTAAHGVDTAGWRIADGNAGSLDPDSATDRCARAGRADDRRKTSRRVVIDVNA